MAAEILKTRVCPVDVGLFIPDASRPFGVVPDRARKIRRQ